LLINVQEKEKYFQTLSTTELLTLSHSQELSAAEHQILRQVLSTREDIILPLDQTEQYRTPVTLKRYFLPPSALHKWINFWAVILALPLLKVIGYNRCWTILITAIVVWLISSSIISLIGSLFGKWGVRALPLMYIAAYYVVYTLLYERFY
jgi:hypothetical protein